MKGQPRGFWGVSATLHLNYGGGYIMGYNAPRLMELKTKIRNFTVRKLKDNFQCIKNNLNLKECLRKPVIGRSSFNLNVCEEGSIV